MHFIYIIIIIFMINYNSPANAEVMCSYMIINEPCAWPAGQLGNEAVEEEVVRVVGLLPLLL